MADEMPDYTYNTDSTRAARRRSADGIMDSVEDGGPIQLLTLTELLSLLEEKTHYPHHIAVEIQVGALLKTVDNEADAHETIRRLRAAPPKKP